MNNYERAGRVAEAIALAKAIVRDLEHPLAFQRASAALTSTCQIHDALTPLVKVLREEMAARPEPEYVAPGTTWSQEAERT